MTAETLHNSTPIVTPSQEKARSLFVKEYAKPEDRVKRMAANTGVLAASTLLDLGESYAAEYLIDKAFEGRVERLEHEIKQVQPNRDQFRKQLLETKAQKMGVAFVEDSMSDFAYAAGMNALLRSMTGMEHAEYVSEASAFASEWFNVISLVRRDPKGKFEVWQKSENVVNPVNVEAGIRIAKDLPLVGGAVTWAHDQLNHVLHKSIAFKVSNSVAAKFITGYHIQKNMLGL